MPVKLNMSNYIDYKKYIKSDEWKEKSTKLKKKHPFCYCCESTNNLAVHHTNYFNLGNENLEHDLKVLCNKCHRKVHFSRSGRFYSCYPRTYQRVKSLRKIHLIKTGKYKSSKNLTPEEREEGREYYKNYLKSLGIRS